jgi:hypothetical protein
MSEINTTTEAVERRCELLKHLALGLVLQFPKHCKFEMFDTDIATLRALAAERDALVAREDERNEAADAQIVELEAERDAARAECVAMASQVTKAQAQVARLREALVGIDAFDPEGAIDNCSHEAVKGLVLNMGRRARAALAEAPRHD